MRCLRREYLAGFYYYRRKAYDPAIVYFKGVVANYPESRRARDAYMRLIESYRVIRYKEEAAEACTNLRKRFSSEAEVAQLCPTEPVVRDTAVVAPAVPPRKP